MAWRGIDGLSRKKAKKEQHEWRETRAIVVSKLNPVRYWCAEPALRTKKLRSP